MRQREQLAREISLTTSQPYQEIICAIEKIQALNIPEEKIESILHEALKLAKGSSYSLPEAADVLLRPFLKRRRHSPALEELKSVLHGHHAL